MGRGLDRVEMVGVVALVFEEVAKRKSVLRCLCVRSSSEEKKEFVMFKFNGV